MALRSVISSRIPMVIILGATGTGKTKLGVELAQKFETEIISADSMQIYKGLDVVTAKASRQERELVRHHLLDILEPHQTFTVVDFRNKALKIIENLIGKGKIPIIVGGTNYYIESVVYKILVENMNDADALLWDTSKRKRDMDDCAEHDPKRFATDINDTNVCVKKESSTEPSTSGKEVHCENADQEENTKIDIEKIKEDFDNEKTFTNEEIHEKLKAIDPVMAARLHPNNRRKVLRSIEVWLKTGRRHSEILAEQTLSEGELRRPGATVLFWLKCERKVHDERLDARVDAMLEEHLIEELLDFHTRHNKHRVKDGKPPDYTKGVFQTLGFKEFHEYLVLSEQERNSEKGKELLQQSIENMKMATRRYARRQNKMIKARFMEHPRRQVPLVYELDTTDISKWDDHVKNKAIHIIESLLMKTPCLFEPLKAEIDEEKRKINAGSRNYCEACERLIIGDKEYKIHLNSNRHLKVLKKKKKLQAESEKKDDKVETLGSIQK